MRYIAFILLVIISFTAPITAQTHTLVFPKGVEIMSDQTQTTEVKPLYITKTDLEQRFAELKKAHQEAIANVNALAGAMQQIELFIQTLTERETPVKDSGSKASEQKEIPGIVDRKCDEKGCK
jgi:hypothetical protein